MHAFFKVAMYAVTVFVDGLKESPTPVLQTLKSLLEARNLQINVCIPTVPKKDIVNNALTEESARVSGFEITDEYNPSEAMLSSLAKTELLHISKLTLAGVQQAWCSNARSGTNRVRINLCSDSALFTKLTMEQSPDLSAECKTLIGLLTSQSPAQAPLMYLFFGDPETPMFESYHEAATTENAFVQSVNSIETAAILISEFVEPMFPPKANTAEFL